MAEAALHPAPSLAASNPGRAAGLVLASTVGNGLGVTPAITASFGVFLVPITAEFHWPRSAVSAAVAVVSLATALASPLAGRLGDAWGPRATVLLGSLGLGLSILTLGAAIPQAVVFYLQFAVIGALGALPSSMLYAKLISEWFESRRGLWMGIAGGVGNGLGATFIPVLAGAILAASTWRIAYFGVALMILLVGLPLQILLIPRSAGEAAEGGARALDETGFEGIGAAEAFASPRFWILASAFPLGAGFLTSVFATIVPLLTDRGVSLEAATTVVAVCGLTCTVWEPTVGYLLDRSTRPRVLSPLYLVAAAGLTVLLWARSEPVLLLGGAMIGLGLGAEFSALSFLLSRYFGRRELGAISGLAFGVALGAGALAIVLLNLIFDLAGSYRPALLVIVPILVWNSVGPLLLGDYPFTAETDAAPGSAAPPAEAAAPGR